MALIIPAGLRSLQEKPPVEFSLKLPAPYHPWQQELIGTNVKLAVYALGTKAGKTLGANVRLAQRSFLAPAEQAPKFRICAPVYRQTRLSFAYLNRLIPTKLRVQEGVDPRYMADAMEVWDQFTPERSNSKLNLRWGHNDAEIECMHMQNPDHVEGDRIHGQIIDECAKVKEASYAAAMTTTTQTGGWTLLISTPKGQNWFYKVFKEAEAHEAWAKQKGIPPTMIARTIPSTISPYVKPEIIENARRTMPDRLFRQLYMAEFIGDGAVFPDIAYAFRNAVEFSFDDSYMPETHDSEQVFVGVDWAKSTDWTVFIAINDKGKLLAYRRMQKMGYIAQNALLFRFLDDLKARATKNGSPNKNCEVMVAYDETGVGNAVGEITAAGNNKGYAIAGHTWTNSNKEEFVNDLILSLEERALELLPWHWLNFELKAFEVETSAAGNPIYGAPDGQNDDTVMAFLLANKLFRQHRRESSGIIIVDNLQAQIEYLYYNFDPMMDDYD